MPFIACLQIAELSTAQAPPTSWMRGLKPGGHVHKEVAHLLSPQPAFYTSSSAF